MLATTGTGRRAAPMSPDRTTGERRSSTPACRSWASVAPTSRPRSWRPRPGSPRARCSARSAKSCLVGAVAIEGLRRTSNPHDTRAELAAVDRTIPLEDRLTQAVELGRRRMSDVVLWIRVLRTLADRSGESEAARGKQASTLRSELAAQRELQRATVEALTAVIRPDADRLRVPVEVAVAFVESAIAGTHARVDHLLPAPPAHVVADALVNGIARPAPAAARPVTSRALTSPPATTATHNREH